MPQAQYGNQSGRGKGKSFKDALRYALKNYQDDEVKRGKALKGVARTLVKEAIGGNLQAVKEIADRLDGKPAQAITGAEGKPLSLIERVIVVEKQEPEVIEGEIVQESLEDKT